MVERDPRWYFACMEFGNKDIYPGYILDITGQCNLRCQHCYHDLQGGHRSAVDVIAEATYHGDKAPFILSGGEPTLHPDLFKIIDGMPGPVWLLTNGVKMSDFDFFEMIAKSRLNNNGMLNVGLSFHVESDGADEEVVEMCRDRGLMLDTCFFVINDVSEIKSILEYALLHRDVLDSVRIKAASNLWTSHNAAKHIFISDMLAEVTKYEGVEIDRTGSNKLSYASLLVQGMKVKLVSWYDKYNVDLNDIDCPPYMKAKDGSVNNFVTSALINEGLRG
jgi:organic radical activating enzyme